MSGMILPVVASAEAVSSTRATPVTPEGEQAAKAFGLLLAGLMPTALPAAPKPVPTYGQGSVNTEGDLVEGEEWEPGSAPAMVAGGDVVNGRGGSAPQEGVIEAAAATAREVTAATGPGPSPQVVPAGHVELRHVVAHEAPVAQRGASVNRELGEVVPITLRGEETGVLRRGRNEVPSESAPATVGPVASAVGRATRTVDASRVERSLGLLAPEFRVRLERVITRMETEHGHRVDVVETLRHQVRQNQLFEQGRTQPGPVVTWTRSSNHTRGLAADVIIDGSYNNPAAYARLHRIAAEEGLRTLGARDPGHLELPSAGDLAVGEHADQAHARRREVAARPARPVAAEGAAQVARVAQPAATRVAQVALVATPAVTTAAVARVAAVATPGKRSFEPVRPAEPTTAPAPDLPRVPGPAFAMADALRAPTPEGAATNPLGAGSAERIAHLMDLQSSAPLRPLSQVLLRVDGPGGEDRIRLDLRGLTLGATLDINDPAAAERLNARIGELQRALEQRGLETESLRVRTTPRADTIEISKLAAAIEAESNRTGAMRSGADSSAPRDRSHDSPRDEPRQNPTHSRQRSRKDSNGGQNT